MPFHRMLFYRITSRKLANKDRLVFYLGLLTGLFILSSCSPYGTSPPPLPVNLPTIPATAGAKVSSPRPFIDTWENVHVFQTFDYRIENPASIANRYDFVWGAGLLHAEAFRSAHPDIFTSFYIPFNRDWGDFPDSNTAHPLDYWKTTHPDWILYQCDRTTPAYIPEYPNVPLDITNPAVLSWQIKTYAQPASANGYDAIAADNILLQNTFGACGVYRDGRWQQLFTGQPDDPNWRAYVLNWLKQTQQALHQLPHPLALVTNFYQGRNIPLNDPQVHQIVNYSDGILAEEGFTNDGKGYVTDTNWLQTIQFMEFVQSQQKPIYIINRFSTPDIDRDQLQWALSSYLMGKGHTASLFIATSRGYGAADWYNEYEAQIGSPLGPMYQSQHVYFRSYSHGLSIVNPSADHTYTITLDGGKHYVDLYGAAPGPSITLPPHSGMVLLLGS